MKNVWNNHKDDQPSKSDETAKAFRLSKIFGTLTLACMMAACGEDPRDEDPYLCKETPEAFASKYASKLVNSGMMITSYLPNRVGNITILTPIITPTYAWVNRSPEEMAQLQAQRDIACKPN